MTATKQTELLPCRNCGGQCDPTGWMCGDGRQGPECEGCGITTPDVDSWNKLMAHSAEPVQGEATVKECLTVELVENSTYGGLHIKEWHSHGLSAGRHKLYTSPAKPDAELVELLRELREVTGEYAWDGDICERIDAKLAELQSALLQA